MVYGSSMPKVSGRRNAIDPAKTNNLHYINYTGWSNENFTIESVA